MSLKNREGKRLDEVTMKEEDCYGGRDFFFYRWICVGSIGIDVLALTDTWISCHCSLRRGFSMYK